MTEEKNLTHIRKISVQNFRAIRELNYAPRQINILTGRNNTGKTALLDAIAFNVPGYIHEEIENYDIEGPIDFICCGENFAKITSNLNKVKIYPDVNTLNKEQAVILPEYFEKMFENIDELPVMSEIKKIFRRRDFRNDYTELILENYNFITFSSDFGFAVCPYPKRTKSGKQYDNFSKKMDAKLNKLIKKYEIGSLVSQSQTKRYSIGFYLFALEPNTIFLREHPIGENIRIVKISHSDKLFFEEISDEDLIPLEDFIIKNNIVKNLRRISQKDIVYQNSDESLITIPIKAHGDGLISLLNVIRYLLKAEDGILIIEEPENHMHPRYIDVFIENLFEYTKKLNVQIFMSTHSLDLIQTALKYPNNIEEKEMLLISKMSSDGRNIEKFDYSVDEGLKVIDELYQDLRGN